MKVISKISQLQSWKVISWYSVAQIMMHVKWMYSYTVDPTIITASCFVIAFLVENWTVWLHVIPSSLVVSWSGDTDTDSLFRKLTKHMSMRKHWIVGGLEMRLIEFVHGVAMTFTAPVPYMQGLGTNDRVLVRVMVSRCEVDMVQIKKTFYQKYHKTLGSFIKVHDAVLVWAWGWGQ